MNQLCVPVPSATDTTKILEEVFKLCRIPWIYDFIFCADPAADISMLLAPVQKRHALSARIFVNATETSSRYAHSFDYSKELMFYSIPAFSIGPITAGFCVEQPAHLALREDSKNLQCIRFIRDDRDGVFLHVSENEGTGVTEVDCLTHKSSTRRTRVRMKFDMHALRSVLRTDRGILHPADISSSLIYMNVCDEKRACPVCRDPTATHCACTLPLRRPKHPLDFQYEASNMGLYTGFYQGATVVRLSSAGRCINATLQSGSVFQGELNSEITTRLHKLAVVDRLGKVKEKPSALIMPASASALNLTALIAGEAPEEAHALAEQMESNGEPKSALLDTDGLFGPEPEVGGVDLDGASVLMDTGELLHDMTHVEAGESNPQSDEPVLDLLQDSQEGAQSHGPEEEGGDDDENNDGNVERRPSRDAVDVTAQEAVTGIPRTDSRVGGSPSFVSKTSMDHSGDSRDDSVSPEIHTEANGIGHGKMTGIRLIGRKGGGEKDSPPQATATSGATELDKAEIRKKRNRESAARSNLKRKLRNERVRKDLASLTQRAIRLRVKEMMLRGENTRLRNAVRRAGLNP